METRKTNSLAFLVLVSCLFAACSASRSLTPYTSEKGGRILSRNDEFAHRLDEILPDSLFPPSNFSLVVGTLDDCSTLYERNADMVFTPASNQKLLTSAAALAVLGPAYRFETFAALDTLRGGIYIHGGGDPILSPSDLDLLADTVALYVGRTRAWNVIGDASRFDSLYWGEGWMWDDAADPSGMGVSALTVNANTVDVHVVAGGFPGSSPQTSIVPATSYVRIDNECKAVDSVIHPLHVTRPLQHPSNTIIVSGEIRRNSHRTESVAVWEPDRFTTTLFAEALARRGVRTGEVRLDTMPGSAFPVARIDHTLDTILTYMNKVSDNLSAECLLKTLGANASGGHGSWDDGTRVVRNYLEEQGIDTTKIVVVDGSGLSRYDLTTTRTIFRVLAALYHDPVLWPYLYRSLPIAGRDGTLESRMSGTRAENHVHAKTGTVTGVSSLSGVIDRNGSSSLAFSLMMEDFPTASRSYRAVQDSIVCLIDATFGPSADSQK